MTGPDHLLVRSGTDTAGSCGYQNDLWYQGSGRIGERPVESIAVYPTRGVTSQGDPFEPVKIGVLIDMDLGQLTAEHPLPSPEAGAERTTSTMGKLDGKVAFITGAARGQGRSHAVRLASEGADIIAADICQQIDSVRYPLATPEDLDVTRKEVEALDRRIVAVQADVRDRTQLRGALDQGLAELGRLDIVCANAGICPMEDVTLCQGFVDAMDVDLGGVMSTVAVSLPHLEAGASIIVTGSTAGMMKGMTEMMGMTGGVGYSLAKQMLAKYVEVLALQLAPRNIRLNAIHPTNVNTQLLHNRDIYKAFRPDLEEPTREDAELAFPGMQAMPIPYIEPGDVSALVLFLASDDARYMTGLNIRLDAGAMLKTPMF